MANPTFDCESCEALRQDAPSLICNGFDDTMCSSLMNDTGLNPSSGNDDCTDLNHLNDCLVGNEETELEMYEVCDWKSFMKQFIPNLWTTLKAIICSICGIWTHIHDIEDRADDMCALINQSVSPVLTAYGILPLANASGVSHRCGTATSHVLKRADDGTLNQYTKHSQNIGIAYASMTIRSCTSNKREMLEWIAPSHYLYYLAPGAQRGDVLWKITKSEAQRVIGISDFLWTSFTQSSWTWTSSALYHSRQKAWIKIAVGTNGLSEDEMGVIFMGCDAPNDAISTNDEIASFNNAEARMYKHTL